MMKRLHVKVEQTLSTESISLLTAFLGGLEGVQGIQVERVDIGIQFDEQRIPDEHLFTMTKSSIEMLGNHLSFA